VAGAYPFVKNLHVACVALSLAGFAARGVQARADPGCQAFAFAGALAVAGYVVAVALTRNPLPGLT
jgi:hypothetical protein